MQVKHLDHLNMSVGDFDESVDWYGRVFGFELVEEDVRDGERWGVIRSGEAMLCIYEHPELNRPTADEIRRDHGVQTLGHFALRITDRAAWETIVARENLELLYGGPVAWPNSTAWYVTDPTGYEIEVALWDDDRVRFGA